MKIEDLREPVKVGEIYDVPCILGYHLGLLVPREQYWAVLLPVHEDSEYFRVPPKEVPEDSWHYHIDVRFHEFRDMSVFARVIFRVETKGGIVRKNMKCTRQMPEMPLVHGFGPKFVDDYAGKKMKCGRCPHRGINLSSMPIRDGIITCPAHGLRFSDQTKECISDY